MNPQVAQQDPATQDASVARRLIDHLRHSGVIRPEDWTALELPVRAGLDASADEAQLLAGLVAEGLLTEYQAARIGVGEAAELIVGNYRVLDCLGRGGAAVVLKGEHLYLRRPVAIKVLRVPSTGSGRVVQRFSNEVWAIAHLDHPHIAAALDAGRYAAEDGTLIYYFVMAYIPGCDLEEYVAARGPMPVEHACEVTYEIASALEEAHRNRLVHRDIKPSNVRLTPEGRAKLLDFGVARSLHNRLTDPGSVLGTLPYLAPEQARDASAVDGRADLFSLGGVLFFCLTGRAPFAAGGTIGEQLARRQTEPAPSARLLRPDVPPELDAVLTRLMALQADDRYPTAERVRRALVPFLSPPTRDRHLLGELRGPELASVPERAHGKRPARVLIVDDEPANRLLCKLLLEPEGFACVEASNGQAALELLGTIPVDLILLDMDMPVMGGAEMLTRLRRNPPGAHVKVIMFSGRVAGDEMAPFMTAGVDDFLTKPFSGVQLLSRVNAALRLKTAQEHSDRLLQSLLTVNHELEEGLTARDSDLIHARNGLVMALAELVANRDTETGAHLLRLQHYVRCLAEEASLVPAFAAQVTPAFIDLAECCAPLHDIGKVGVPDHVLLKAGPLTPDERRLMQMHTTIGADTLGKVMQRHAFARAFLQMAMDIARYHHERWDGSGYPDGLKGDVIPLAARLVTIGDVYDALRSRRVYKPALAHGATIETMRACTGLFDPALFQLFLRCAERFEKHYADVAE